MPTLLYTLSLSTLYTTLPLFTGLPLSLTTLKPFIFLLIPHAPTFRNRNLISATSSSL